VTTPAEVKKAFQDALTESELLDKVIKSLPARRIHFWDNNNLLADHYIADIDAGTYSAVPASAIGVVWGIQKSILGNQAKDWLEIGYSAGNAGADMRYFGQRVDQYESLR